MEIYLIRHTTPNVVKGTCYGFADVPIKISYQEELALIKEKLSDVKPDIIYSSPLKRCSILANEFSEDVIVDNRLKEMNFGDWELQNWNNIPREISDSWMNDFVNVRTPNGESYIDLNKRVISFFKEIAKQDYKTVFVFTHAGVIRSTLARITNTELKDSFNIKLDYGEVVKYNSLSDYFVKL